MGHHRVFQIALGGWMGTRNFAGGGGGICTRKFFQSFKAFVMLKLIFHIY